MICPVCGTTNEAGARFCFRCGSALQSSDAGQPASTPSRSTPAFGSPVVTEDTSSARVYDVPTEAPAYQSSGSAAPVGYQMPTGGNAGYRYPGMQQPYSPYGTALPQQSNTALIALIMGILSFVVLPFVGAIVAIVLGRNARREIQQSGGRLSGDGMALAGIVLGWINIALIVIPFCLFLGFIVLGAGLNSF